MFYFSHDVLFYFHYMYVCSIFTTCCLARSPPKNPDPFPAPPDDGKILYYLYYIYSIGLANQFACLNLGKD